jgi:hypothetical protein
MFSTLKSTTKSLFPQPESPTLSAMENLKYFSLTVSVINIYDDIKFMKVWGANIIYLVMIKELIKSLRTISKGYFNT